MQNQSHVTLAFVLMEKIFCGGYGQSPQDFCITKIQEKSPNKLWFSSITFFLPVANLEHGRMHIVGAPLLNLFFFSSWTPSYCCFPLWQLDRADIAVVQVWVWIWVRIKYNFQLKEYNMPRRNLNMVSHHPTCSMIWQLRSKSACFTSYRFRCWIRTNSETGKSKLGPSLLWYQVLRDQVLHAEHHISSQHRYQIKLHEMKVEFRGKEMCWSWKLDTLE